MPGEAHERKVKRIKGRDWQDLQERWIRYVPIIEHPGKPPEILIKDLPELDLTLSKIERSQVEEVLEDIPGLRQGVLHESVFLLHKAAHVLGSSLMHVSGGMCTWSISSAYQAAFFAMKSILGFLGVTVVETSKGHFMIDVWGSPHKRRRGVRDPVILLASTGRNEQRHLWAYFQRTLDQTTGYEGSWDEKAKSLILQREYKAFARHRNRIHYVSNEWLLDDLHRCVHQEQFGITREADESNADFSLIVAVVLVSIGHRMLSQLSESSEILRREELLLKQWLSDPMNELYHQSPHFSQ